MFKSAADSIVELAQALVKIPSQSGFDDPANVVRCATAWLSERDVSVRSILDDDGRLLGVFAEKCFSEHGPSICLNACLDTAPVGMRENWSRDPFSGILENGWLCGRGAADSKIGAALFAHLFAELTKCHGLRGNLSLYLDADEHKGDFSGIKKFVDLAEKRPDFVFIGYPGNAKICVGARGIYRVNLTLRGKAAHTGASDKSGKNAIDMAANFIAKLGHIECERIAESWFGVFPKISVTTISGGASFSIVPDTCRVGIDCRLTGKFDAVRAERLIRATLQDAGIAESEARLETVSSYPAYDASASKYAEILKAKASLAFGREIPEGIAGPSNIGNALSELGIPSTCGFGVEGKAVHGPDECANTSDVDNVYQSYKDTLLDILS